jgi:hypothetical protein
MNKKKFFIAIVFVFLTFGCKNQHEKLKIKFTKIITSYMEENMANFCIDSVFIMGIDSLTDLDFAYFQKIVYENRESEILANRNLYIPPVTDEEFGEQEKLQSQLQTVRENISLCNNILLKERTDTISINYFFVATKIFGKDKKGKQQIYEIGFPIDKNFTIKEIDF